MWFPGLVLLQNNTKGPQSGGGAGSNYVHMHRLVHMITGQWGEDITTTTTGSFIDKTYKYSVPESYNSIPVVFKDLELAAFIAEDQQEIITGVAAPVSQTVTAITELNKNARFSIFPNPAKGEINLDFSLNSSENLTLKIFDNSGKLVGIENYGLYHTGNHQIKQQSSLKPGVYHVELSGKSYVKKQKVVIVN